MKTVSKFGCLATAAFIIVTIAGCASTSQPTQKAEQAERPVVLKGEDQFNNLVSRDVVSVLAQINDLAPASTTLGTFSDDWQSGDFADSLRKELETAGYAIRSVSAGQNTLAIGFSIVDNTSGIPKGWDGRSQTVTIIAGDIALRRSYLISSDGGVSPVGRMQVKGVDARTLTLRNDIFDVRENSRDVNDGAPVAPKTTADPSEQVVQNTNSGDATTNRPDNLSGSVQGQDQVVPKVAERSRETTFLDLVAPTVPMADPAAQNVLAIQPEKSTENVLELQQSNFEDLFADMAFVNEKVLTFADDSTRMGEINKARLQALIDNFEAESDIFSLVGCSLGQTNYAGGQEGLARGRAMRVREELLYAGIPADNIVEEGCWAEEAFDLRMPRRGVVVTLKRRLG